MHSTAVVLFAVASAAAVVAAQKMAFEVASVKPQTRIQIGVPQMHYGTRFREPNQTVQGVIEFAYNLSSVRIVGGPRWIRSDLWTIDARTSAAVDVDEMRLMVRQLLAERFRLNARFETRELPIYEMRLARQDGALGPNAKPAANCEPIGTRSREELRVVGTKACGLSALVGGAGFARVAFRGAPLSALGEHLESALKRVVRDRTGLNIKLDLELTYASETGLPPPESLSAVALLPEAPPLSTALREQLGLRLETASGPVEVLVIESVERPMPD